MLAPLPAHKSVRAEPEHLFALGPQAATGADTLIE